MCCWGGICGEAKIIVFQEVLTKMKIVFAQNAWDFAEVCKANLHCITAHLMAKEQLQRVENLECLECFSKSQRHI